MTNWEKRTKFIRKPNNQKGGVFFLLKKVRKLLEMHEQNISIQSNKVYYKFRFYPSQILVNRFFYHPTVVVL